MVDISRMMERQAQTSNDSNKASILSVTGFFMGWTVVVMALRLYVRKSMLNHVGPDDYIMLASVLCGVGVFVCFVGECSVGMGTHFKTISKDNYQRLLHWEYAHSLLVTIGISLIKLSVAFFLYRLTASKHLKRFLIFMIGVNIATDVLFASLPIPMVWTLQVNWRIKFSLMSILSLGYLACIASAVKLDLQTKVLANPDSTWKDSYYIWNSIEHYVGILAASLPSLRPLFASLLENTSRALKSSGLRTPHIPTGRSRYYAHGDGIRLGSISNENTKDGAYSISISRAHERSADGAGSFGVGTDERRGSSEENIWPPGRKDGIMRTTRIDID
ncbi:MAG: hypothetical protein M1818_002078 [Claussenomyces sp. TS43310]|nr:MAG: hypothetical protein M1818_002078 [Claussenomyces sp. TS43310]